jgi:hypothetical protein
LLVAFVAGFLLIGNIVRVKKESEKKKIKKISNKKVITKKK